MRGTVQPSLGAAMGLLWGHLHRKTRALCLTEGSHGSGRGDWSCCPLLGFRCSQPRVPQCQELVSVGSPMLTEIFHQLGEPHGPSGSESPLWGERHLGLPRGRVRNLFTSISRYMRPFFFFFLFTIIVTLVNPSINRQIRLQGDRVWRGGEGDIYVYVQLLQDRPPCFPLGHGGEEPVPRGHVSLYGVWRADDTDLGSSSGWAPRGWQSQAGAEVGDNGGVVLPWGPCPPAPGPWQASGTASLLPARHWTATGPRQGMDIQGHCEPHPGLRL